MKGLQDKINDFETEFQIDKERWNNLRAERYAERKASYYDLEREYKWRGVVNIWLMVILFLAILLIGSLTQHPC